MKKAMIIFIIIFVITLLIPMLSIVQNNKAEADKKLTTIFSSQISVEEQYHLLFQD